MARSNDSSASRVSRLFVATNKALFSPRREGRLTGLLSDRPFSEEETSETNAHAESAPEASARAATHIARRRVTRVAFPAESKPPRQSSLRHSRETSTTTAT